MTTDRSGQIAITIHAHYQLSNAILIKFVCLIFFPVDMEKPCDHARLLRLCHSKATCMPAGKGLYYCKCPKGYTLNGETCQKIKKKGALEQTMSITSLMGLQDRKGVETISLEAGVGC